MMGAHKTSLTLPLFLEVHVTSQENEQLCIHVFTMYQFCLFLRYCNLIFGIIPTEWNILLSTLFNEKKTI